MMSAYEDQTDAPTVLLATLPGERHGLGLEMVELHLAASHVVPLLLGIDTPPEQIVKAARSHGVEAVALLIPDLGELFPGGVVPDGVDPVDALLSSLFAAPEPQPEPVGV